MPLFPSPLSMRRIPVTQLIKHAVADRPRAQAARRHSGASGAGGGCVALIARPGRGPLMFPVGPITAFAAARWPRASCRRRSLAVPARAPAPRPFMFPVSPVATLTAAIWVASSAASAAAVRSPTLWAFLPLRPTPAANNPLQRTYRTPALVSSARLARQSAELAR